MTITFQFKVVHVKVVTERVRASQHHQICTVFSRVSAHGRLKFMGQKMGVGPYTEKPFVHITYIHVHVNHRIIKNGGGGHLHRDGCLLGRLR